MKRSVKELFGSTVRAKDGDLGTVKDFYFDNHQWVVRYMVVDTRRWLHGRQVLISTAALKKPERMAWTFPVNLTMQQVKNSPSINTDKPVSRQHESQLHDYYKWPIYWAMGLKVSVPVEKPGNPYLRSTEQVTGYRIRANDGEIGHVQDFIVDDESWAITYVVVNMHRWVRYRTMLVAPQWIKEVSWGQATVFVDLSRESIKTSPIFDPAKPVSRDYEEQLFDHYGKPKYWEKAAGLPKRAVLKGAVPPMPTLIINLASNSATTQVNARHALVSLGKTAVKPLVKALTNSKQSGRAQAAKALGEIGDVTAAPALVAALEDEKLDVRWLAARALVALGREALPSLLEALSRPPASTWLREGAHHVLHDEAYEAWSEQLIPVMRALSGYDPVDMLPSAARKVLGAFNLKLGERNDVQAAKPKSQR